jgi:cystathionine gamma-lyase / homocysteine desulfhydrase
MAHHPETEALHYRIDNAQTRPVATPIYQNSAFTADSPYFYTRKSNPNSCELEGALALLEGAAQVITTTTGMSAISLVLQLLKPNDHLLINAAIYGCSYRLFQRYSEQFNIRLTILDLSLPAHRDNLPDDLDMVLFETPTNPFLKTIPIREIADRLHRNNPAALLVVDNTWATPLFQAPLECGADLSLASATKYISGHSDVMGGFIACNDRQLASRLLENRFYTGAILDPHSAWLLRRSLHTLPIRMREHARITRILDAWLRQRDEVETVFSPTIDAEQLRDYGGILFFQFATSHQHHYADFATSLKLFDTGTGMACISSMVAQPWSGSHASLSDEDKRAMGIDKGLVRLCFGLENEADLITDLAQAFDRLGSLTGGTT